uniref:2-phosphoxylose phosphatase 1 n=1 Tax=Timema poppense TaxID=170557 RepID=A0A7R9DB43_TIMPO|nr:unnamed protein product [Timema poppensis]
MSIVSCFTLGEAHVEADVETRSLRSVRNKSSRDVYIVWRLVVDQPNGYRIGQVHNNYILEGVLILLRHGDRGPLSHVRNISSVNCAGDLGSAAADGWDSDASYRSYELFLQNMTGRTTNFLSQLLGPFHGFPLLPAAECQLAQLTPVGAAQLLRIGHLLRTVYGDRLGGFNSTEDFLVYSTRYRRTVQSVVAFLYAFLSPEDLAKVALRESQSLTFCFNDCACAAAERFQRKFHAESTGHLRSHPAVGRLVRDAGAVVFELPDQALASDPHALRDALLAYVCHGAPLPCLDQPAPLQGLCVRVEHVTGLFAYTEWEARQYGKSGNLKRACLLKAYGLLRNIVSNVLRIISEGRPRVVVYSGHDKTLQYLVTALGFETDSPVAPHYGSRLVLEVYKSKTVKATSKKTKEAPIAKEFFFRLVYNGRDVTNRIQFCKGGMNLLVQPPKTINVTEVRHGNSSTSQTNVKKLPATYICPIESIVRFLHDDYFEVVLRVSHSSLMSSDRMKPGSGDWACYCYPVCKRQSLREKQTAVRLGNRWEGRAYIGKQAVLSMLTRTDRACSLVDTAQFEKHS